MPGSSVRHENSWTQQPDDEHWPGGTQYQLSTVGIGTVTIIDQVTAHLPTTVEAQLWDVHPGVPMLRCRRITID